MLRAGDERCLCVRRILPSCRAALDTKLAEERRASPCTVSSLFTRLRVGMCPAGSVGICWLHDASPRIMHAVPVRDVMREVV